MAKNTGSINYEEDIPADRRRHMKHGFRQRMRTRAGRALINRRRAKGRKSLAA